MDRDLFGYGGTPPNPEWPNNARLALSFVLNVEEGAELSISLGDERNESHYEIIEEVKNTPDLAKDTHFEYGTRAGYWRIMNLLDEFRIKCTLSCCARALSLSPWLAKDAIARGHEIACHSYRWERHADMNEAHERSIIKKSIEEIQNAAGYRPVGWHTRSAPSINTRRLLVEEGGFLYDSDAYNDDLPFILDINGQNHIVIPYAFDTNDMRFQNNGGFTNANDFADYCINAIDWLWVEGEKTPKMMSIGLHLRIIGRPARILGLKTILKYVKSKGQIWVARRDQIASHWRDICDLDNF